MKFQSTFLGVTLFASVLMFSPLLSAAETTMQPDREWEDAGDWQIYWNQQFGGCVAEQAQAGNTSFVLGISHEDKRLSMLVLSPALSSFAPGQPHEVKLLFDGKTEWTNTFMGVAFSGRQGILGTYGGGEFREQIAHSSNLAIRSGGKTLLTLTLKGTRAATNGAIACYEALSKAPAAAPAGGPKADLEKANGLRKEAIAAYQQGKFDEALAAAEQIPGLLEPALGPDHEALADAANLIGAIHAGQKDLAGAKTSFAKAVSINEKAHGIEHPATAQSIYRLAQINIQMQDFAAAEPLLEKAVAVFAKTAEAPKELVAAVTLDYGNVLLENEKPEAALPVVRDALDMQTTLYGDKDPRIANALYGVGLALQKQKMKPEEQVALFTQTAELRSAAFGADNLMVGDALLNLSEAQLQQSDFEAAKSTLERTLAIYEKAVGPDHPKVQYALESLSLVAIEQLEFDKARTLEDRALAIRKTVYGEESAQYALGLMVQSRGLIEMSDYRAAEAAIDHALVIQEKLQGGDTVGFAASLTQAAHVYASLTKYEEAEKLASRACDMFERLEGKMSSNRIPCLRTIGQAAARLGRPEQQAEILREVAEIADHATEKREELVSSALKDLAISAQQGGKLEEAEALYRRVLETESTVYAEGAPEVAATKAALANVLSDRTKDEEAETLFRDALQTMKTVYGDNNLSTARVSHNFASHLMSRGHYDEAQTLQTAAVAAMAEHFGKRHPYYSTALQGLARLEYFQGKLDESKAHYEDVLEIEKAAYGANEKSLTRNGLSDTMRKSGDYEGALAVLRPAAEANRARRQSFMPLVVGGPNQSEDTLKEGFVFLQRKTTSSVAGAVDSLAARAAAGTGALADLIRQKQDLEADLAKLDEDIGAERAQPAESFSLEKADFLRGRYRETQDKIAVIQQKISTQFPEFSELEGGNAITVETLQSLLQADEALVMIDIAKGPFDGDDYVYAVTKDRISGYALETEHGDVAKAVEMLRAGLAFETNSETSFDKQAAFALYKTLLGPAGDLLKERKHILFVLNGAISSLPPQVLISENPEGMENGDVRWLIRDHAISVLPSASSLKLLRESAYTASSAAKPMRGYGDPVFSLETADATAVSADRGYAAYFKRGLADVGLLSNALAALPETADELRMVAASLNADEADLVLGSAASETAVKNDKLDDYEVVYFATHGLVAGEAAQVVKDGAEPALVLSLPKEPTPDDDGLLTSSEIARLKLNAKWVVLSACNTAAGDNTGADALSGLARSFFYAGARSMLVSHWSVASDATVELMTETFKRAAEDQAKRPTEALREAMLAMMEDSEHPQWSEPSYWAPFVLVGQPG
ncbi:CHAT domain-containing protein [Rhizobium sp. L1K21]|uniref:CHAT domain-containing protein n=1 Tax=Rhizobium sp. L1K21 TaxID=2954933 RepID=UPI00209385BA|nr:CHAT domain-containing protein [Rhizobium sp. L1K21]MCO6184652.1 tetratricopeptide repeat protein [Rhizobium sp. L1K21]